MLPLNRDKNGATNIATNFLRLMRGEGLIRSMTEEDIALHHASPERVKSVWLAARSFVPRVP